MTAGGDRPLPEGKLAPGLLAELLAGIPPADDSVVVGPAVGEDAAAVRMGSELVVLTTDPITFVGDDATAWLVQVNANDIAAMGARPRYLTVTALFPPGATAAALRETFRRLAGHCTAMGIALVGGHTEVTRAVTQAVLVGQMAGVAEGGRLHRSRDARNGDRILLAGAAGREGSAILARRRAADLAARLPMEVLAGVARWAEPPGLSVVDTALALAGIDGVHALHDATEGGVAGAVREVAVASGRGCRLVLERIPVRPETWAICDALGLDWLGLISSGLLVATVEPAAVAACLAALAPLGVPAVDAGEIIPEGFYLERKGTVGLLPSFEVDEIARGLGE
jgi:hydrogenase maturation factor